MQPRGAVSDNIESGRPRTTTRQLIAGLAAAATALGLTAVFTLDPGAMPLTLAAVLALGIALERALDNLVGNAAKHTAPGCPIWITATPADGGVLVAVDDAGTGVAPERRDTLFEPFVRGRESSGFGLGLHVAAQFVTMAGGRIWVDDRQGGGASFRLWLRPTHQMDSPNPLATDRTTPVARRGGLQDNSFDPVRG